MSYQIKTIIGSFGASDEFDKNVNEAIADGWKLAKRRVIRGVNYGDGAFCKTALIAELYRCCENIGSDIADDGK